MDIEIKKELAVSTYQITFDRELAYTKAEFTEDEIKQLDSDQEFQDRLNYFLVLKKEELATEFWSLIKSPDEKVRLKTILELGPLIYPEFFNRNKVNDKSITADEVRAFFDELTDK